MIEKLYNAPQVKPILEFNIDTENNNQVNNMYIDVLKKEIELGNALNRELGCKWVLGEKLDTEDLEGRKYQLKKREEHRDKMNPLPF